MLRSLNRAALLVLAASLLLSVGALSGCKKSSSSTMTPDAGTPKDGPTETPASCANDNGSRNLSRGQACTCAAQCATGFCADGYCCNTACDGTCMKCDLGQSLGICTAVPAGVKPRNLADCTAEEPSTCGLDGTCDGKGQCRVYEAGTICIPGSCNSDAITNTSICDGMGQCRQGPSTVCAPFSCDSSTRQCYSTCANDGQCVSGRRCTNGSCGKKMNGALCPTGDAECASGHCADGVCCNTACGGACQSCNLVGLQGTCSPVSAGKGHPLCARQDPTTCGTTGVCDGFGSCSRYPATTPCGASTCVGATAMTTVRTCDGLGQGICLPSETQQCGKYRCANGACNSTCKVDGDCADGIACMNGSCGLKLDGQKCVANTECQNQHCVDGVCCNTACTGACRSCSFEGSLGRCTMAANGAADPRTTCADMTAATCGTDGKCDGTGLCRKYATGTVCAGETCAADIYTGPSTCNSSGQCIKPNSLGCYPYHCNVSKCFGACVDNTQCIPPNSCGMNGNISSCGPKPIAAPCSANNECASSFCAQGVCCNSACTNACQSCNLPGTPGSCTNVASGVDPQGKCAVQAQSTCGTTGQCTAGQCARWASGSQCAAASCTSSSTRAPASTCNGTGTCVTPATMSCAPGRCAAPATGAACVNTCTNDADCTPPATCGSDLTCGLQPKGGPCTTTSMCAGGLTCYLAEGANGVCCDTACSGTCESCKRAGLVGTCSPIPAGMTDPDPLSVCVAAVGTTCGLNGKCAGNNTTTNGAGTTRCQFYDNAQGCRSRSCTPGTATTAAIETAAASCTGTGTCPAVVMTSCSPYNKCTGPNIQCATSCTANTDCVGVTCNTKTGRCGDKLGIGAACGVGTDCTSGVCADGVCCNSACSGACQACNLSGNVGTCTNVTGAPPAAPHPGCAATTPCGLTGQCSNGACATSTASCQAASCSGHTLTAAASCSGTTATCPTVAGADCPNGLNCAANGVSCLSTCGSDADCAGVGVSCNSQTGVCGQKLPLGAVCGTGTDCTSNNCVDGRCCNTACNGACQACGNPSGTCSPVTSGADGMCNHTGNSNPCLNETGSCTMGGVCAKVGSSTPCGATVCSGNSKTAVGSCNGSGTCVPGPTTPCAPFTCNATNDDCLAQCTADGQCSNGQRCNLTAMTCTGRPIGAGCSVAGDCANGQCVDGTCCSTATTCGVCQTCAGTGTCHPGPDGGPCNDGNACTQTDTCQGGSCTGSNPVTCGPTDDCHLAGSCSPADGSCTNPTAPDTTPCGMGMAMMCMAGVCQ